MLLAESKKPHMQSFQLHNRSQQLRERIYTIVVETKRESYIAQLKSFRYIENSITYQTSNMLLCEFSGIIVYYNKPVVTIPRQQELKPSKHAVQVIGPLWVNFVLTDRIRNKIIKNFLESTIINKSFSSFGLMLTKLLSDSHTHTIIDHQET